MVNTFLWRNKTETKILKIGQDRSFGRDGQDSKNSTKPISTELFYKIAQIGYKTAKPWE